ncbi:MAG: hypothetical protein ACRDRO_09380, partial [Pseudonocardiaceae bacterium]
MKLLTENQVLDERILGPSVPANETRRIYISYYINGYGQPRTSSDLDRRIRPGHGQPAGSGGVLPATTDQKV